MFDSSSHQFIVLIFMGFSLADATNPHAFSSYDSYKQWNVFLMAFNGTPHIVPWVPEYQFSVLSDIVYLANMINESSASAASVHRSDGDELLEFYFTISNDTIATVPLTSKWIYDSGLPSEVQPGNVNPLTLQNHSDKYFQASTIQRRSLRAILSLFLSHC